jgi:hypothetical protein
MKKFFILIFFLAGQVAAVPQQVADSAYNPVILHPEYAPGKGPVVFIDEGHNNFHTKEGRYMPFTSVLEKDGYVVKPYAGAFTREKLSGIKLLVIANALNAVNTQGWYLPTPSAFSNEEIVAVREWITGGGSLFLIADHMPFAGAAAELAGTFGFSFSNGFAFDTLVQGPSYFTLKEGTMNESIMTRGRDNSESVQSIVTFTGQAFTIPNKAIPILVFGPHWMSFESDTAWVFNEKTRRIPVSGWCQGAFMDFGKGRIAVFGEAAMFTAQLAGPNRNPVGMNSDYAGENYKLLLNIIHWLDGR